MTIDDFDVPLTEESPKTEQDEKYELWKGWGPEKQWKKMVAGDRRNRENLKKKVQRIQKRKGF